MNNSAAMLKSPPGFARVDRSAPPLAEKKENRATGRCVCRAVGMVMEVRDVRILTSTAHLSKASTAMIVLFSDGRLFRSEEVEPTTPLFWRRGRRRNVPTFQIFCQLLEAAR